MKFLLLLLMPFFCNAADYYVTVGGNDLTGDGSIGNPWRTLYKATSTVTTSGNTINVSGGVYLESFQSSLAPGVNLLGADTTAVIKWTGSSPFQAILLMNSVEGTNGNQYVRNIKFDGRSLSTQWGIYISGRSNVTLDNVVLVDFYDVGIMWKGRNDNTNAAPTITATGNIIKNCKIRNSAFADGTFGRGALSIGGQTGMLISRDTIDTRGRAAYAGGWPIKYTNDGYLNALTIDSCELIRDTFPGYYNGDANYWNFVIEFFNVHGLIISNNRLWGSIDMNYVDKGAYTYGAWIHHNNIGHNSLTYGNENGMIFEYSTSDIIVEDNYVHHVAYGLFWTPRTSNTIRNFRASRNRIVEVGRNTFGGGQPSGSGIEINNPGGNTININNFIIDHNTIRGSLAFTDAAPHTGIEIPAAGPVDTCYITNNIVENFFSWGIRSNSSSTTSKLYVQNNDLYNNGGFDSVGVTGTTPSPYTKTGNLHINPATGSAPLYIPGNGALTNAGTDLTTIGYTGGNDVTPPTVTATNPANGATGTLLNANITITFDGPMDQTTLTSANVYIDGVSATVIPGYDYVILAPLARLAPNTTYTYHVSTSVKDAAGNNLASTATKTFTTGGRETVSKILR